MSRRLLLTDDAVATSAWSTGVAQYLIERESGEGLLVVAARCRLASMIVEELALIDTGAQWSVLGGDHARILLADPDGPLVPMSTRLGRISGRLSRIPITLVADEGDDLYIEATVLIAPDWSGPIVLGYRGLLERVRFGMDPGTGDDDQVLFFGGVQ